MSRLLSVLLFLVLAGLLFLMPAADPGRMAALSVPSLMQEKIGPKGARIAFAGAILKSAAVTHPEPKRGLLRLATVHLELSGAEQQDATLDETARRSFISALRQSAAQRKSSFTLEVAGERRPEPGGARVDVRLDQAALSLKLSIPGGRSFRVSHPGWRPPERESLVPPLLAILLAILFRRPIFSLFCGVWAATFLLRMGAGGGLLGSLAGGLPDVASDLFWPQFTDPGRAQIIGFVIAMLAMVGVMTRSGGIRGLMDLVSRLARNARRTQVATWLLGLVVFFDDYANCILVGSTMRPLCDRFRIAREKLSYLVDSTAAPVAGLSIFSTWIAFEVSTFSAQLPAAGLLPSDGYAIFIETLPFRFYCILAIFFSGMIAWSGRDFGPMLQAERRARSTGALVRPGGRPMVSAAATALEPHPKAGARAHRALLPVLVFVLLTMVEIVRVGFGAMRAADPTVSVGSIFTLRGITTLLGGGESTRALLVGSVTGLMLSVVLALRAGLGKDVLRAAWTTIRSMGIAIAILYLAWMIGRACDLLGTAPYLTALIGGHLKPEFLPAILFLTAALVAFSTGSSWSTMSILLPLVVGLAYHLGQSSHLGGHLLMVMSVGAVLEGSIFGDHCSPISDTTILSSTASASDHIDHVRTQIPYALTAMLVALLVGYLPCAVTGTHPTLALLAALCVVLAIIFFFGRKSEPATAPES